MVMELIVIGFAIHIIFGDYIEARADLIREEARAKQFENDRKEANDDGNDPEGS